MIYFLKISTLQAKHARGNLSVELKFSFILHWDIFLLHPKELLMIVNMQRDCLIVIFGSAHVSEIVDDFHVFKRFVFHDEDQTVWKSTAAVGEVFAKPCCPFIYLFKYLVGFCGGLATVFPSAANIESDFSILQWEKACTARTSQIQVWRESCTVSMPMFWSDGLIRCKVDNYSI